VGEKLPATDVLIMAAAPADFRPASEAGEKIKKGRAAPSIEMEPTEDILLSTMSKRKKNSVIVGFALETGDGVRNAKEKLKSKNLDIVVLNDAKEPGAGFGVDTNRVTVIARNGKQEDLQLMSKADSERNREARYTRRNRQKGEQVHAVPALRDRDSGSSWRRQRQGKACLRW